jgi:hypothetical protein
MYEFRYEVRLKDGVGYRIIDSLPPEEFLLENKQYGRGTIDQLWLLVDHVWRLVYEAKK